jgi:hypothetical protein
MYSSLVARLLGGSQRPWNRFLDARKLSGCQPFVRDLVGDLASNGQLENYAPLTDTAILTRSPGHLPVLFSSFRSIIMQIEA